MVLTAKYDFLEMAPIYAPITAPGTAPLALLRLSGQGVFELIKNLDLLYQEQIQETPGGHIQETKIKLLNRYWPATLLIFRSPHSYTGEDSIEFQFPGHPVLMAELCTQLAHLGAREAGRGEFTRRAFLNNKIDLTQAKAVLDIIAAENDLELRSAVRQLGGSVKNKLFKLQTDLLKVLAECEGLLDVEDAELNEFELTARMPENILAIKRDLEKLRKQTKQSEPNATDLNVILEGPVNAGKSSLFNALASQDVITSTVPGSTRDVLCAVLDLDGIKAVLLDTPGHKTASNSLEKKSLALTNTASLGAECRLWVMAIDNQVQPPGDGEAPDLIVINKSDLKLKNKEPPGANVITVSAKTGQGLPELRKRLREMALSRARVSPGAFSRRQSKELELSCEELEKAAALWRTDFYDLSAEHLRCAVDIFQGLQGGAHIEGLLDEIFDRFCVGK